MNKLLCSLSLLIAPMSLTAEQELSTAAQHIHSIESSELLCQYHWTGTDEYLFLDLIPVTGIDFPVYYVTGSNRESLVCEIYCEPSENHLFLNQQGEQLTELKIKVEVANTNDPNVIAFSVKTINAFKHQDHQGKVTFTEKIRDTKGKLSNSLIDLSECPTFFISDQRPDMGGMKFKNLAPLFHKE